MNSIKYCLLFHKEVQLWKDAFSVNVFTEYVWTEDKTKADACACWRGLRVILGPVYMEVGDPR